MNKKYKTECRLCGWRGSSERLLRAKSPFDQDDELVGCPECKQCAEGFDALCDIEGCNGFVAGGMPTKDGDYIFACYKHLRI